MPHTSVRQSRKCGVKPRSADQIPFLRFRDLRFCCQKSGCARRFRIFPRTSGKHGNTKRPEAETRQISFGKQPLTRQPSSRGAIKIGDALRREGTPLQNFGLIKQASVFHCATMIAQVILSNRTLSSVTNSPSINDCGKPHIDYLCKKFKSR